MPNPKRQRRSPPELAASIAAPPLSENDAAREERIAKVLAAAGVASRRECEELVKLGRISIDGKMTTDLSTRVDPFAHEIRMDDQIVHPEPKVYWLLNKPKGVLSTSKDTHGRKTVLDLLPNLGKRIFAVGRLDEDSTGLLLMTNDGEMALRLTHPRYQVGKTYVALVAGRVTQEALDALQKGVWLSDGKVQAHFVKRLGTQGQATRLQIVLKEGHNREIRRMFAKVGHKIMALHRTAIGPLKIRKLNHGEARPATSEEIYMLRRIARLVRGPSAVEEEVVKSAPKRRPGLGRPATAKPRKRAFSVPAKRIVRKKSTVKTGRRGRKTTKN